MHKSWFKESVLRSTLGSEQRIIGIQLYADFFSHSFDIVRSMSYNRRGNMSGNTIRKEDNCDMKYMRDDLKQELIRYCDLL